MATHFPQERFEVEKFRPPGLHLHTYAKAPRDTLVVLIHGFMGRGYKTWELLPERLFNGHDGRPVDVGVYDYVSGPVRRTFERKGANFQFWCDQLGSDLRRIAERYQHIFLVGHSMGGAIAERIGRDFVQHRSMREPDKAGPLAGIVLIAAPRAGSGWATRFVSSVIPEFDEISRLSDRRSEVEDFYAEHIERTSVATAAPGKTVLPAYAALGGSDHFVRRFSATFGIPVSQRLYIPISHSKIARPGAGRSELVRWLTNDVISARIEVRDQVRRQQSHVQRQRQELSAPRSRPAVLTKFSSDMGGLRWEEIYNEARQAATTGSVSVVDVREAPGAKADLLLAVHDARSVVDSAPDVQANVHNTCEERLAHPEISVGISPVGDSHPAAVNVLRSWTSHVPPGNSFYIEGASGPSELLQVLARFMSLAIPRERRLVSPGRTLGASFGDDSLSGNSDGGGS